MLLNLTLTLTLNLTLALSILTVTYTLDTSEWANSSYNIQLTKTFLKYKKFSLANCPRGGNISTKELHYNNIVQYTERTIMAVYLLQNLVNLLLALEVFIGPIGRTGYDCVLFPCQHNCIEYYMLVK